MEGNIELTDADVELLNEIQKRGYAHPYTCGSCDRSEAVNDGRLIATKSGWICPCGKWRQPIKEKPDPRILENPFKDLFPGFVPGETTENKTDD